MTRNCLSDYRVLIVPGLHNSGAPLAANANHPI